MFPTAKMITDIDSLKVNKAGDTMTGTLSATKLVPTGNVTAGNGMYLPTTNTLAFSTNGVERMRLTGDGNLQISGVTTLLNYSDGALSVNETGVVQIEPTFKNLSLGESYANDISEYYFTNGYTVSPTDAGYQYAKLIQQGLLNQSSLLLIPQATKADLLALNKPNIDLDVVRATGATRVNANGLIETVGNNVARLDYPPLGGCPSLLVEPQRTNLITYSEEFDNVAYTKLNSSITANAAISPDGNVNADKLVENTAFTFHLVGQTRTLAVGLVAYSFYAKASGRSQLTIDPATAEISPIAQTFNLENGTSVGGNIEPAANGFYRCSGTFNVLVAGTRGIFIALLNSSGVNIYLGDGVSGVLLWGMQYEQASYPTSYIPTVASAVTRNADVISKTGISDLIGQTEGTLYAEITAQASPANNWFQILDGTSANWVFIGLELNTLRGFIRLGGATQFTDSSFVLTNGVPAKVALAYKSGDIAFYINGTQIAVSSATFTPSASLDRVIFGDFNNPPLDSSKYSQAALYPVRLSNSQLESLTTL
jgi:hypothetical protein